MKRFALSILPFLFVTLTYSQTQENLKIVWPEEYKWKIGSEQESETIHFMEIVPGDETIDHWTLLGTMMSLKNTTVSDINEVTESFKQSALARSSKAKLTVLEKDASATAPWILFKIETPSFTDGSGPESQLYYVIQGDGTLYISFVAMKEKSLSKDFVSKWTRVFKSSELVSQ